MFIYFCLSRLVLLCFIVSADQENLLLGSFGERGSRSSRWASSFPIKPLATRRITPFLLLFFSLARLRRKLSRGASCVSMETSLFTSRRTQPVEPQVASRIL